MFKGKESVLCPSSPFLCSLEKMREDELAGQSPILSPACPWSGNMSGEVTVRFCTDEGGFFSRNREERMHAIWMFREDRREIEVCVYVCVSERKTARKRYARVWERFGFMPCIIMFMFVSAW